MSQRKHRRDMRRPVLPAHHTRFAQRFAHKKRRQLVRKLLTHEREEDIPCNTPKHVRWDYW